MFRSWPKNKRPPLSLQGALSKAQQALGKEAATFYPLSATTQISSGADGDWLITFGSTSGEERWVILEFRGKVIVRTEPPIMK